MVKQKKTTVIVKNAVKSFGNLKAVDNLSFNVENASCFGFLGPNGAGKTTMMKMLYGKSRRDDSSSSVIKVLGCDPKDDELFIKYFTGIVPQEDNLDLDLSVEKNLYIYSKFYGIKKKQAMERIEELLDFMQLTEKKKSLIRELSGGMKRRLVIARSLLNNPKLLILDEPTTGLDPQVRHLIWEKLMLLKKQGVTILLTTHYMEEAFQICDKLIMMNKGQKVLEGSPISLINKHIEKYVLEITEIKKKIPDHREIRIESTDNKLFLYSSNIAKLEKLTEKLKVGKFYLRQSNLEDVFLKITGRKLEEN